MARNEPARIALVTGATRGIGHAIARSLASSGMHVIVAGRDALLGKKVASDLGNAVFRELEVTDPNSIEAAAGWIASEYGGLDVLVNNAGIALDGLDAAVARRTLDVNFVGTMRVTDRLLPRFRRNARIVMVSSGMGEVSCLSAELRNEVTDASLDRARLLAFTERFVSEVTRGTHAKRGWPSSAYRVSKVAMNAYTRIVARELAKDARQILVNAACPGWVRTAMGGAHAPRAPEEGARTPVWLALLPVGGPSGGFFRDEARVDW